MEEAWREKEILAKRLELLEKDHESAVAENVRLSSESDSLVSIVLIILYMQIFQTF